MVLLRRTHAATAQLDRVLGDAKELVFELGSFGSTHATQAALTVRRISFQRGGRERGAVRVEKREAGIRAPAQLLGVGVDDVAHELIHATSKSTAGCYVGRITVRRVSQLHLERSTLEQRVDEVRDSPQDNGTLEMIVRRPELFTREVLDAGELDTTVGLVGDNWSVRGSKSMPDGSANPDAQLAVMNARAAALIAGDRERWPLAGDQLYVDFDLTPANVPAGTRLAIGSAIIEVTAKPHTGCPKFAQRFGADALRFVMSQVGSELNLRGINAKVVQAGAITQGDAIRKL